MDRFLSWNVRGINSIHKQDDLKRFLHKYNVGLVGLLEDKVKLANLGKIHQRVFSNWCFTSNASHHDGGRVIVEWGPCSFLVNILVVTSQFIHCHVSPVSGIKSFYCTFIYTFNDSIRRQELWSNLKELNTHDP